MNPEHLRALIAGQARLRDLPVFQITLRHDVVTVKGRSDGAEFSVVARIRIPRRQRSLPEVTILPGPYAHSTVEAVKASIRAALGMVHGRSRLEPATRSLSDPVQRIVFSDAKDEYEFVSSTATYSEQEQIGVL